MEAFTDRYVLWYSLLQRVYVLRETYGRYTLHPIAQLRANFYGCYEIAFLFGQYVPVVKCRSARFARFPTTLKELKNLFSWLVDGEARDLHLITVVPQAQPHGFND